MSDTIVAIRVFKGESTADIMAKDCKMMRTGIFNVVPDQDDMGRIRNIIIPGIWYMLDASKSVIPIIELPIFVPMTAIVQIAYELPF